MHHGSTESFCDITGEADVGLLVSPKLCLSTLLHRFLALYFPPPTPISLSLCLPPSLSIVGWFGRTGERWRGDQWGLSLSGEHGWIYTPSPWLDVVPTCPRLMGKQGTVVAQVVFSQQNCPFGGIFFQYGSMWAIHSWTNMTNLKKNNPKQYVGKPGWGCRMWNSKMKPESAY